MNGNAGNDEQVPVEVDKAPGNAAVCADKDTSCDGKRTVQPGGQDHAAVFLNVECHILILNRDLRIALDAEGGRIEMACCDVEGSRRQVGRSGGRVSARNGGGRIRGRIPEGAGRKAEGNERGAVAHHIVATARDKMPGILLAQRAEAGGPESPGDVVCGEQRGRTLIQKGHEVLGEGSKVLPGGGAVIGRFRCSCHDELLWCR